MSKSQVQSSGLCVLTLLITLFSSVSWLPAASQEASTKAAALPSAKIPQERLNQYSDLAVQWMQEYLRIDTTNPPGNETRAAEFFKKILDKEGIENRVFDYAPGRADLWARIPHTTPAAKRPLILLNHMDVVTSDPSHWKVPPFSGTVIADSVYGRGAQDMKEIGRAHV